MKYIFLFLSLLLSPFVLDAQEVRDFTFSHVGPREGMCSQRIYSVVQTADGALWWSGKDDVERYNGQRIRHYQIGQLDMASNYAGRITKLKRSDDAGLMAFDNKGCVYVYDEVQDRFRLYADVSGMMEGDVLLNDILLTPKGLWLAMREGVWFLEGKTLIPVMRGVYVNTFVVMDNSLLICTRDGVLSYSGKTSDVPKADMKLKKLMDDNVESGYYDAQQGKVWLGGFVSGLHILTVKGVGVELREEGLTGDAIFNPVRSICPYDDGTMLVGIDGQGVFKVPRQAGQDGKYKAELLFDANEGSHGVLHGNGIYALLLDLWGNIVVGSYSGGIDIARPVGSTSALFQHIRDNQQSLLNDHVNCVSQWPDGCMTMGTDNGVSLHNPFTQQWHHCCHGAVVLDLCLTPQGTMLAATYGQGVYEMKEDGQARLLYTKSGGVLRDDHVYKLLYDRQGNLWMGCLDGDLVKASSRSEKEEVAYFPIHNVQDMVQLPDNRIAVGTASGIWIVDGKTGKYHELDYSVVGTDDINKYVYTLYVNNRQELWIGTDGGGVYVYDLGKKTCRQMTKDNGLPSNAIYSICKDGRGRILIATDQGLSFVSPEEPSVAVDVNYCYGLSREYSARAAVNLQNGHVLYGSTSGALIINPDNIQKINYTARLNILSVSCSANDTELFNKRVHDMLQEKTLRLHYSERTFELYFESINLRNQFDIACQYRVGKGEWSQPSDQQYIRFTNLEPGTHLLTIRAVSRTSGAVLDEQQLTIIVAQPWWNSWWMWFLYICLVVLAFYGAWRIYQLHTKYMRLVVSSLERESLSTSSMSSEQDAPTRSLPDTEDRKIVPTEEENVESSEFIEKVTKMVVDHLSDTDFSIDRLCREMAMSRTLFYIKLKTHTGKSPQDFIRFIRLERAAALLRNGRSVTDTATLTGFDNAKYFSTVFKKYFGISPSKYC